MVAGVVRVVNGVGVWVGVTAVSTITVVGATVTGAAGWSQAVSSPRRQTSISQDLAITPGDMAAVAFADSNQFFDTTVTGQSRNQFPGHRAQPVTEFILAQA